MTQPTLAIDNSVGPAHRGLVSGLMAYTNPRFPYENRPLLLGTLKDVLPHLNRNNPTVDALARALEFIFENSREARHNADVRGAVSIAWGDIDRLICDYHTQNWAKAWDAFQGKPAEVADT